VNVSARIQVKPDIARLPQLYTTYGLDPMETVVPLLSTGAMKLELMNKHVEEVVSAEDEVVEQLRQVLEKKLGENMLCLESFEAFTHDAVNATEDALGSSWSRAERQRITKLRELEKRTRLAKRKQAQLDEEERKNAFLTF
jgi:prohibitin 1